MAMRNLPLVIVVTFVLAGPATGQTVDASSQDPPRDEWDSITDALRGHEWADGTNNLLDIVRAMPDSAFHFVPATGMNAFSHVVAHIADVQLYFCKGILGYEQDDTSLTTIQDRSEIESGLMRSIAACDEVFDTTTDQVLVEDRAKVADNLTTMMGHSRRETGKLVTYLRLAGVEPPEIEYYAGRKWRS
jgi:uncharacterized damage-inducible protein DinB